jgi:ribitol 2-dehydrogenase
MTYGLAGKRVVITGAGSGIGLATTRKLVEEGAIVIAGDLNVSALSGVIEKVLHCNQT